MDSTETAPAPTPGGIPAEGDARPPCRHPHSRAWTDTRAGTDMRTSELGWPAAESRGSEQHMSEYDTYETEEDS